MKKDDKGRVIEPGDIVTIKTNDKEYTGEVLSADYWGAKSGWYIELVWGEKGYFYYKQEFDGGDIIKINSQGPMLNINTPLIRFSSQYILLVFIKLGNPFYTVAVVQFSAPAARGGQSTQ